jgi:Predicted membrane protein (DUF2232)
VSLLLPIAAPVLMPLAVARLARTGAALRGTGAAAVVLCALSVPFAFLFGMLGGSTGSVLAPALVLVSAALPALALLASARDGRRLDLVSIAVGAVTGACALAVLVGIGVASGQEAGEVLARRLDSTLPELLAFYRTSGLNDASVSALQGLFEGSTWLVRHQLPGLVLLASFLYGALVTYPVGRIAGVPQWDVSAVRFPEYRTPLAAVLVFVPAGLLAAVGPEAVREAAVDLLLPLCGLFFLRGLAIIRAFLDRGGIGLVGRALVWALVLQMPVPVVVALGGLFDEFFGFRERFLKPAGPDGRGRST